MHNANDLPITISLPQGFTIGGVTTWALAIARRFATPSRQVRLIAHPPLEGHATFDPGPSLANAYVRIIHAPALSFQAEFDSCVAIYAAQLPTLLLPNLCAESYAVAARLSETRSEDLRVIAWIHGDNPVDYAYLEHYEPIVHRYVAVSRRCQSEFTSRRPHREQDIAYIPHALPLPRAADRTPLVDRPLRILYAGRMELGVKRVVDILAIARRLSRLDMPFDLRLIGDGPHADMIDARIASLTHELEERRGSIRREAARGPHEMNAAWQWADVAILTSRLEGFSVSTLEAMAAGCVPVVT
ncbi:MAG: glycosyltransferase family 4 protein, partial [Phycisphaerales bacterium]|nr:glycosyltransferase family 4 protein [Phycisphaerales bacterium]